MQGNSPIVLDCTDNPKNSALYFDYVIPFKREVYSDDDFLRNVSKIYPDEINRNNEIKSALENFSKALANHRRFFASLEEDAWQKYLSKAKTSEEKNEMCVKYMQEIASKCEMNYPLGHLASFMELVLLLSYYFIEEEVKSKFSIMYPPRYLDEVLQDPEFKNDPKVKTLLKILSKESGYLSLDSSQEYNVVSCKLANLPLIDTRQVKWDHILEFRKDKSSVSKLRKLKTFIHNNYSGKEKNYIQDDLLNRIEEYKNAAKDWGFETITSSITLLNTSITSVGTSLVMALTGQPLEVAAASGLCMGIGNVSLHLAKKKYELMKLGRDHPLAYIIDAKKKLEKE